VRAGRDPGLRGSPDEPLASGLRVTFTAVAMPVDKPGSKCLPPAHRLPNPHRHLVDAGGVHEELTKVRTVGQVGKEAAGRSNGHQ
jgi:hypothetical protein